MKDLGVKKLDIKGWVVKIKSMFDELRNAQNRKEEPDLSGQLNWIRLKYIKVQNFQK